MKRSALTSLLLLALPFAALASAQLPTFTYQGSLKENGQPANGNYNMTFTLYDVASGGTAADIVGTPDSVSNWPVTNGVFSIDLAFPGAFSGQQLWLEVNIGGQTLANRQPVNTVPVAQDALTSQLAYSVAASSIGTTQINAAQVQRRVTGVCSSGSSISVINQDGTVNCQSSGSGTITGVTAGTGLSGGGASGSVSLSADTTYLQRRVASTCASGAINAINADGTVTCQSTGVSFTLPYAATQANNGALFNVTNTDSGASSTALQGTTDSTAANVSAVVGVVSSSSPGLYSAGVRGISNGTNINGNGIGVFGTNAGYGPGVNGTSNNGPGVFGASTGGYGVYAMSSNSQALYATSNSPGLAAFVDNSNSGSNAGGLSVITSGGGAGVFASSNSGAGLHASSNGGPGLYATSSGGNAAQIVNTTSSNIYSPLYVATNNSTAAGIQSEAVNQGVSGTASGTLGYGIAGFSTETTTVFPTCCPYAGPAGVHGQVAGGGFGVHGVNTGNSGYGVLGEASSNLGVGVYGYSQNGTGVEATGSIGLFASGNAAIYTSGPIGINKFPQNPDIELTISSQNQNNTAADITLLPYGISDGFDINVGGTGANDLGFGIYKTDGSSYTKYLGIDASGNLSITGANAYKPGGGTWIASSDRRIKQDIHSVDGAVETLLKLRPVSYHYTPGYRAMENNLPDKLNMGFIAQEFREVFPEAVSSTGKSVPGAPQGDMPILAVDMNPALITAVAAVQELAVESFGHDDQITRLEGENAQLHRQLWLQEAALQQLTERLSRLEQAKK